MQFMVILKATKDSEAGVPPTAERVATMVKYNQEMAKAGVLLDAAGLYASSKGARVSLSGTKCTVTDGPFTETKELVAGFWVIKVGSKQEAIEWAKRLPNPPGVDTDLEVRQMIEFEA